LTGERGRQGDESFLAAISHSPPLLIFPSF
jgi:hypothetical protein